MEHNLRNPHSWPKRHRVKYTSIHEFEREAALRWSARATRRPAAAPSILAIGHVRLGVKNWLPRDRRIIVRANSHSPSHHHRVSYHVSVRVTRSRRAPCVVRTPSPSMDPRADAVPNPPRDHRTI